MVHIISTPKRTTAYVERTQFTALILSFMPQQGLGITPETLLGLHVILIAVNTLV